MINIVIEEAKKKAIKEVDERGFCCEEVLRFYCDHDLSFALDVALNHIKFNYERLAVKEFEKRDKEIERLKEENESLLEDIRVYDEDMPMLRERDDKMLLEARREAIKEVFDKIEANFMGMDDKTCFYKLKQKLLDGD